VKGYCDAINKPTQVDEDVADAIDRERFFGLQQPLYA